MILYFDSNNLMFPKDIPGSKKEIVVVFWQYYHQIFVVEIHPYFGQCYFLFQLQVRDIKTKHIITHHMLVLRQLWELQRTRKSSPNNMSLYYTFAILIVLLPVKICILKILRSDNATRHFKSPAYKRVVIISLIQLVGDRQFITKHSKHIVIRWQIVQKSKFGNFL